MSRYLNFLLKNKFSVILLSLMIIGIGWIYINSMPQSIFPDVNFPRISVLVHSDRLPVKFMLVKVAAPLEAAAEGEPGIFNMLTSNRLRQDRKLLLFHLSLPLLTVYRRRLSQIKLKDCYGDKMPDLCFMANRSYLFAYFLKRNQSRYQI